MTTPQPRRRKRSSAAQRQEFLAQYHRSGLSVPAFVDQHGLNLSTFYQWIHRTKSAPRRSAPLFKEVLLSGAPLLPAWTAELAIGNEFTLRLGSQISAKFIVRVIQQLRRPC